jgi:hypothetical protein
MRADIIAAPGGLRRVIRRDRSRDSLSATHPGLMREVLGDGCFCGRTSGRRSRAHRSLLGKGCYDAQRPRNLARLATGMRVIVPTLMVRISPALISSYSSERPIPVRRHASGMRTVKAVEELGGRGYSDGDASDT